MNVRLSGLIVCLNVAQLPIAMRPLLIALVGAQAGGFSTAGLAGGAAATGMALSAPWWSRGLPRFGDRRILITSGTLFLASELALAISHGPLQTVGAAALSGLCTPPISSSVRSMLPRLTSSDDPARAYAANAVAVETVYIGSPLWVSGWVTLAGPAAALVASALIGALALAAGIALAPALPHRVHHAGPSLLAMPAVRTLGAAYLAYWICMGAMWVLVPAFAAHAGAPQQSGLLVALWSAGSLAGGLILAARRTHGSQRDRYLWLLGTLAATSLPLAVPGTIAPMAVAITVFGVALAPWLATNDHLAASAAGRRSSTLFGWLTTAGQIGSATGAIVAGPLADRYGGGPAFLVVTAALGTGLAIALHRKETLPRDSGA
ncbi:MFS transporter [Nonomuraea angiospora]|uniref:MFS family permease n=1 Tax=Nonomuraea angiospora TaxID=46172 RepID=A0ABR9MFF6_9ACTN|nr:MFS transporter [Nonomuraea angiospora]MBE1591637.1 MFS family permease [Nonomuraea angiospora]